MPFGEYESFEDCVAKNGDKEDPEAYCAAIKRELEGATAKPPQTFAVFNEPVQVTEDVACCLRVNAVIAKEGIYDFPAGPNGENRRCLWSRPELLKAARTARAAKITIKDHPPNKVVTNQDEIYGTVEKPFFDRDRIRATLCFDKDITPPTFLDEMRAAAAKTGDPKDVSIGFYYTADETAGMWHGQPYDIVMRNMVIDHVATGVWRGRCSFPDCGVGAAVASIPQGKPPTELAPKPENKPKNESTTQETPPQKEEPPENEPPQPQAPPEKPLSTAELLERSKQLLNLKNQRDIERTKQQRRNPLST